MGTYKILYKNDVFLYNANVSHTNHFGQSENLGISTCSFMFIIRRRIQGSFDISSSQRTNVIINKKMFDKKLERRFGF